MTAKEQAIKDIKAYLRQENRMFLDYQEELNPIMEELVEEYTRGQNTMHSWCLSGWSTPL